jgi:hypothetical protein
MVLRGANLSLLKYLNDKSLFLNVFNQYPVSSKFQPILYKNIGSNKIIVRKIETIYLLMFKLIIIY